MGKNSRIKTTKAKKLLAIIVSGIIAIALGLTCGIFFGTGGSIASTDGVGSGSVSNSVTQPTAGGTTDYTPAAAIKNGEILNFAFANNGSSSGRYNKGKIYTIKLPKGKYKFEVWGAQGGNVQNNANFLGYGGYAVGTIQLTAASTTLYVYVGGQGTGGTASSGGAYLDYSAGWNGGGRGRQGKGSGSYYNGGGGGTDIRIGADSLYARVIVAGGGGGNVQYGAGSVGYGGGTSGNWGVLSSESANREGGGGGTQTAADVNGGSKRSKYRAAGFGIGGEGYSTEHPN